jgi:hypothetical protein
MRRAVALAVALAALGAPAARGADPRCLTADAPPVSAAAKPLRFGITPQAAGTVGASQGEVVPPDPRARDAALRSLRPRKRELVIRITRFFESEGKAAVRRVVRRARHFARRGFGVEAQIRYHPSPEQEGDMVAWRRFVHRAAKALAPNPSLVTLSITNEVNLPISPNTSDGAFAGAKQAIVAGIAEADRTLRRHGRRDVELGFTYAYRFLADSDLAFWSEIGQLATPGFRAGLDYVGVQLYPGLFVPPTLVAETAGEATVEALTLVRDCYMPRAGLGPETALQVTEIGFATNLGHTEARQASELADAVRAVHAFSGTLGVTDLRYFNLRDNRPNGSDLFDDVGLLRADYSPKPAFEVYRSLISQLGTRDGTIPRQ